MVTGIYGNDSKVIFDNIEGSGEPQWVSFYYQSKRDLNHYVKNLAYQIKSQIPMIWASVTSVSTLSN
jgi:hypothetical protein